MTLAETLSALRTECRAAGSQAAWANANSLSHAYVSDVLSGRRDPGAKLLELMGLERAVSYAGEDGIRVDRDGLRAALAADCAATGSQSAWAAGRGVHPGLVSCVMQDRGEPSPRLLAAMRLRREVSYRHVPRGPGIPAEEGARDIGPGGHAFVFARPRSGDWPRCDGTFDIFGPDASGSAGFRPCMLRGRGQDQRLWVLGSAMGHRLADFEIAGDVDLPQVEPAGAA